MKVVLAMVVRDEADILDAQLAFHLNAGVDLVLATDHRSVDGTTEILDRYAREGYMHVTREDGDWTRQGGWMTTMARAAATEHGADWVLLGDGDELWWPRGGSLRDVLAEVPQRYGIVRAISRYFVPRPDDDRSFAERMTVRLTPQAPINDPATPFRPVAKLAHRAHAAVVVGNGNHSVNGVPFTPLEAWTPIELLHFPLRSAGQCAQKYRKTWLAWQVNLRADIARAKAMSEDSGGESFFERVVVDDVALERGLAAGTLARDTRFRDALRTLAGTESLDPDGMRFPLPTQVPDLVFSSPTLDEDAEYAVDAAVLREANVVRACRHLDAFAPRLAQRGG